MKRGARPILRLLSTTVTALLLASAAGCQDSSERTFTGTVISQPGRGDEGDLVGFEVELDNDTFAGSSVVAVNLSQDELSCRDGAPIEPHEVEAGDAVVFIGLVEGETPAMGPPPLRGRDFRVEC